VTCPTCGTENAGEARFCVSCGRDLSDATAPIPVAGEPTVDVPSSVGAPSATVPPPPGVPLGPGTPQVRRPSTLAGGWLNAFGRAVLGFAIVAVLGQAIAFGAFAAAGRDSSIKTIARVGGIYFELFHRVGIEFRASNLSGSGLTAAVGGSVGGLSYTISIGLLLVTMLVVFLLYRAGRAVADRAGGTALARVVHGMKIAPFYGLLCLGLSLLIRFHVQIPSNPAISGQITIQPALLGAFLWPFLIALVAGAAGGLRSAREHDVVGEPWGRRLVGIWAGGVRMLALGLLLSFVGLLVLAALDPNTTAAYFRRAFDGGAARGVVLVGHHVLVVPNQSMWVLVPAMGGCDTVSFGGTNTDLLCYSHFPKSIGFTSQAAGPIPTPLPSVQSGTAPPGYFLFLLVPLLSVLLGGRLAASRGSARSRPEAASLGAMAGVVFAALVGVVGLMSTIGITVSVEAAGLHTTIGGLVGPSVVVGGLLALVWGVAGGALGGLISGRKLPAAAPVTEVPAGPGFGAPTATVPRTSQVPGDVLPPPPPGEPPSPVSPAG
jgi:hypothetical protein